MELSYIREFLVLARVCNYKKAAEELFLSQTTLFNHIRSLSDELGVTLFNRAGKGIALSEYGEVFLPYAKSAVKSLDAFYETVSERKAQEEKEIRIGSQYRITNLIRRFKKEHDSYVVSEIKVAGPEQALGEENCELAFIRDLSDSEGRYDSLSYCTDRFVAAVPSDHPLAGRESIRMRDLKDEAFILHYPRGSTENREMTLCREEGFLPKIYGTVSTGSEAAKLVGLGLGVTLLLKDAFSLNEAQDGKEVVLLELEPPVSCDISVCWRKDIPLSEGAQTFLDFVKSEHENPS